MHRAGTDDEVLAVDGRASRGGDAGGDTRRGTLHDGVTLQRATCVEVQTRQANLPGQGAKDRLRAAGQIHRHAMLEPVKRVGKAGKWRRRAKAAIGIQCDQLQRPARPAARQHGGRGANRNLGKPPRATGNQAARERLAVGDGQNATVNLPLPQNAIIARPAVKLRDPVNIRDHQISDTRVAHVTRIGDIVRE